MNQKDYLDKVFNITNFLDKARWGNKGNKDLINFSHSDLNYDTKLLTHWLLYITERQTDFRKIWDIGGFVISDWVHNYKKEKNTDIFNPENDKTFFVSRESYEFVDEYDLEEKEDKFLFTSTEKVNDNKILKEDDFKRNHNPYFIPRYYPSDYKSILSTLKILEDYEYSLGKYILDIFEKIDTKNNIKNSDNLIPKLMFGLYLLSYRDIGRIRSSDIKDFENFMNNEIEPRYKQIKNILDNNFNEEFKSFKDKKAYFDKTKRPWAAIRDFLKNKEINEYFINSLKEADYEEYEKFSRDKLSRDILKNLELPGDVWNNNPTFKECIFPNNSYKEIVKEEIGNGRRNDYLMSEYLRTLFNRYEEDISKGYPEQFDITFDLVPRMCEKKSCEICPYGLLDNGDPYNILEDNGTEFEKVCHGDKEKYCPVLLASCDYRMDCVGREVCDLWKIYES